MSEEEGPQAEVSKPPVWFQALVVILFLGMIYGLVDSLNDPPEEPEIPKPGAVLN